MFGGGVWNFAPGVFARTQRAAGARPRCKHVASAIYCSFFGEFAQLAVQPTAQISLQPAAQLAVHGRALERVARAGLARGALLAAVVAVDLDGAHLGKCPTAALGRAHGYGAPGADLQNWCYYELLSSINRH